MYFFIFFAAMYLLRAAARYYFWGYGSRSSVYRHCREIIADITAHHGGEWWEEGRRRIVSQSPDRNLRLEIDCYRTLRLTIHTRTPMPFSLSFLRLPRLLYAFLEAFLPPDLRIDSLPYFPLAMSRQPVTELKNKPGFLAIFRKLSDAGFSIRLNSGGMTLRKSLRRADLNEFALMELLRLTHDFEQLCATKPLTIPVQAVASEKHCPYCKELIEESSSVLCSSCGTPHHRDCFELNGKCSVFGCESQRTIPRPEIQTFSFS